MTHPSDAVPGAGSDAAPDTGAPLHAEGAPAPGEESQDQADAGLDSDLTAAEADAASAAEDLTRAQADVAALTADLQRLQAEYLNYKRRVDRDRQLTEENAAFKALLPVIEVLDAIDRAREAGDVEGGFKTIAEQLERAVGQSGLQRFGEPGDPFDPTRHDALSHLGEDPDVSVTTVKVVAKGGYAIGERVVRAAQVLVVEPGAPQAEQEKTDQQ